MRKTKFDVYFEISQKMVEALSNIGSEQLAPVVQAFSKSIDQIDSWAAVSHFPAPKSKIANGLEQGINDLPLLFESVEPEFRSKAFDAYYEVVNSVSPGYVEKLNSKIQRILKRGKIHTESEFYLLRNLLDRIEAEGASDETTIVKLLEEYEVEA